MNLEKAIDIIYTRYNIPKKDIRITYEEKKLNDKSYKPKDLLKEYQQGWFI